VGDVIVIYDFETTGFSPCQDAATEIGYAVLRVSGPGEFTVTTTKGGGLLTCTKYIPRKVQALTRITPAMCRMNGVPLQDRITTLRDDILGAKKSPTARVLMCGHNSDGFDHRFLHYHFERVEGPSYREWLDEVKKHAVYLHHDVPLTYPPPTYALAPRYSFLSAGECGRVPGHSYLHAEARVDARTEGKLKAIRDVQAIF
jgi:DNA polymerase III epsilon subunit-like protein